MNEDPFVLRGVATFEAMEFNLMPFINSLQPKNGLRNKKRYKAS